MTGRQFDTVVIGFDGSKQAEDALALGRLLGSVGQSQLVLAYVIDQPQRFERQTREYAQARRRRTHRVLEPALSRLSEQDRVQPASIDSRSPARGLHDLASEYCNYGSGVIVIGSTHRGPIGRVVLGSVGEVLISGCPCPITVAPRGYADHAPASIASVVAGIDGSPESRAALQAAHGLARATGAALTAVAVTDNGEFEADLGAALQGLDGEVEGTLLDGDPADRLAEVAAGADMLVLGARSYGPHHHVLMGSVSLKLMRTSPCPVLVLPRPPADQEGASESAESAA
jgi:nucleotide-binding universal stress UspA family protein